MDGDLVYTVYFNRSAKDAVYQFMAGPIQARVRSGSGPTDGNVYLELNPKFSVKDGPGSTLLNRGVLVAVDRSIADDQRSVAFRLSTGGATTVADFRALEKAKQVSLEIALGVQARVRIDPVNMVLPAMLTPSTPPVRPFTAQLRFVYEDIDLIMWRMNPVVQEKIAQGYFIANPEPVSAVWNTYVAPSAKGGVCGDFKGWGIEWSRPFIDELFGPGSILTWIHVGMPGAEQKLSHVATLAILPNGARYVLDYWMSVKLRRPCVFESAAEWRVAATKEVSELFFAQSNPGMLNLFYAQDMDVLSGFVAQFGEEQGIKRYLAAHTGIDPVHAVEVAAQRQMLVKSYRRAKW
jgi:hypothetical protein